MSKNNRQNRERKKKAKLTKQRTGRGSASASGPRAQPKPNLTLPTAITGDIAAFCEDIAPTGVPRHVDVRPARGAKVNECFVNVDAHVSANGGSTLYGWNVTEWPGVMLEAEFHSVWRQPSGEMVDVTPKADGARRILFLPDATRSYEGKYTPSKQRALADAPHETAAFINACQAKWAFEALHFVDDGVSGMLSLSDRDVLHLQHLTGLAKEAHRQLVTADRERKRSASVQPVAQDAGDVVSATEISRIARSIGNGPLGLAHHRPEAWASPRSCYDNVAETVRLDGKGRAVAGWTFHVRTKPGVGTYVFATPHAVWHNPRDQSLVDVTPYPDPHHAPVMEDGSVLFLVDGGGEPVVVADDMFLSPPLRFFAVGSSTELALYVAGLNERAAADFERDKNDALLRRALK